MSLLGHAATFEAWRARLQADGAHLLVLGGTDAASITQALAEIRMTLVAHGGAGVVVGRPSAVLAQLARSVAAELGPAGQRFNAVAIQDDARVEDAWEAIRFLAGEDASYVTGAMLEVGPAAAT